MSKADKFLDIIWPWRVTKRMEKVCAQMQTAITQLNRDVTTMTEHARELQEKLTQCDRENRRLVNMVEYDGLIHTLEAFGDHAVWRSRVEVSADAPFAEKILRVAVSTSRPLYMTMPFDDDRLRRDWPATRNHLVRRFCEMLVPKLYDDLAAELIKSLDAARK